jgi:hypothetical protein
MCLPSVGRVLVATLSNTATSPYKPTQQMVVKHIATKHTACVKGDLMGNFW